MEFLEVAVTSPYLYMTHVKPYPLLWDPYPPMEIWDTHTK